MTDKQDKHPSFGFLRPDEVSALRDAKWDETYQSVKEEMLKNGSVRKPRQKKPITEYMFTPEKEGKNGK